MFLIVADDSRFRTFLKELITKAGDKWIELEDGKSLNHAYGEFNPDLVLIEVEMKNKNGFKCAEKLKKEFPNSRFIILSNYDDERYRKKTEMIGAAGFVSKENPDELEGIYRKNK